MKRNIHGAVLVTSLLVASVLSGCASDDTQAGDASKSDDTQAGDASSGTSTLRVSASGVQGQYCVVPYAESLGFYDDERVILDQKTLQPTQTVGALLASDQLDVGITSSFAVMALRSEGSKLKAFMGQYQAQAAAVIVPESSDIKNLSDLEGRTVAASASTSAQLFPYLLELNDVDPNKVKIVNVQTSALPQALASGRADAITGVIFAEAIGAETALGEPVRTLKYSDLGMQAITVVYATSDRLVDENPDVLKGFVAATQKGVEAAMEDPQACVDALKEAQGAGLPDDETMLKQLKASFEFLSTPAGEGQPIGWMSPEDWSNTAQLAKDYLDLDSSFDVSSAYTNMAVE
jgi:NitT/TauT family transport system substrate-binding protein